MKLVPKYLTFSSLNSSDVFLGLFSLTCEEPLPSFLFNMPTMHTDLSVMQRKKKGFTYLSQFHFLFTQFCIYYTGSHFLFGGDR